MLNSFYVMILVGVTNSFPDKSCDRIQIEDQWYDRQVLRTDLGIPHNLNVHKPTNTLFFTFSLPETYSDVDFQLGYLNLDSLEYQDVAGLRGGCSTTIDQANEVIYLGGSNGIFKYNMAMKLADFYKENDTNIWYLFHRHNLFYISYPDQKLHMEIDGKFAVVKEFYDFEIDLFYVTRNGEIYFANNTGLYKYNKNKKHTEVISELITVRQLAEDDNDVLYACTNFGVYNIRGGKFRKILDVKNLYGLTFDRNNHFVISDNRSVMKLVKSNDSCAFDELW